MLRKATILLLVLLHLRPCSTLEFTVSRQDGSCGVSPEAAGSSSSSSSSSSSCAASPRPLDHGEPNNDNDDNDEETNPEMHKALHEVARLIETSHKILVVTGAGVSVAVGIPDFRSPRTGLYDHLAEHFPDLPSPESIFDLEYYRQHPEAFVALSRDLYPTMQKAQPAVTHFFLQALHGRHHKLLRMYTQNIDGLDLRAGMPTDKIIECHGHFRTASCCVCGTRAPDVEAVLHTMVHNGQVPRCPACGNPVKPDLVFFGQALPAAFFDSIEADTDAADLLLVLGTSLNVAPVALIPDFVDPNVPRVLFNRERVDMGITSGKRDIFIEGECEGNVKRLVKLLGWQEDILQSQQDFRDREKSKVD